MQKRLWSVISLHPGVKLCSCAALCVAVFAADTLPRMLLLTAGILLLQLIYTQHPLRAMRFALLMSAVFVIFCALTYPRGRTILFFLPLLERPITLEGILLGVRSGCLVVSLYGVFNLYNAWIDSAAFMQLFGRVSRRLSLMLQLTLRLMPLYATRIREITDVHRVNTSEGWIARIRGAISILLTLLMWSLEEGLELSRALRAKHYGEARRTIYARDVWRTRDTLTVAAMGCVTAALFYVNLYAYAASALCLMLPVADAFYAIHSQYARNAVTHDYPR